MFSPQAGRNDTDMSGVPVQGAQLVMAAPIPQPNFDMAAQMPQMPMPQMSMPPASSFSMEALTMALSPLHTSVNAINQKLDHVTAHLGRIERRIDLQGVRIDKLDEVMTHPENFNFNFDSTINEKLEELQKMIDDIKNQPTPSAKPLDPNPLSAVIGGLNGLSYEEACKWLELKLEALQGPKPIYIKKRSENFSGIVIATFGSQALRDQAITILHKSGLDGKDIWAKQDLPLELRVRKTFLNSVKYQLGKWGFVYNEIEFNDDLTSMKVGPNKVLDISISEGAVKCEWHGSWATWAELQSSPEIAALLAKAETDLAKSDKGKGKSKYPTAVQ